MQFRTVERRVFGQHLVHIGALPHAQRIVAQADGHTAFAGLGHEPPEKLPPRRSEEVGLRTECPAVGDAARIGVAIVDLQAADPFPGQHVELPGEMFARQRVADPPIEGHLAVTCRRGAETPFRGLYSPNGRDSPVAAGAAVVQRSWRRRAPGEGSGSVSYSFRVEVGCQQPRTGLSHKNTKLKIQINKASTIKTHTPRLIITITIVFQGDNILEKNYIRLRKGIDTAFSIVSKIKHPES